MSPYRIPKLPPPRRREPVAERVVLVGVWFLAMWGLFEVLDPYSSSRDGSCASPLHRALAGIASPVFNPRAGGARPGRGGGGHGGRH